MTQGDLMETCSLNRRRCNAIITQPVRAEEGPRGTAGAPEWNPGNTKPWIARKEGKKEAEALSWP